jgi:hypothetical protein
VAQNDRVAKQARYELVASGKLDSLGAVLEDSSIRSFDAKLADLRRELANLNTTLTPEHYKVHQIEAQIAETEAERSKFRDRIVDHVYSGASAFCRMPGRLRRSLSMPMRANWPITTSSNARWIPTARCTRGCSRR